MPASIRNLSTLAMLVNAIACGRDITTPTSSSPPVGSYNAISFVTTGTSGQTNQLIAGSSITLTLTPVGTTSGHLHLAASGSNPAVDDDLTGTWQVTSSGVSFTQAADTFMNDLVFSIQPISNTAWYLVADQVVNGTRIQLTLASQP